MQVRPGGVREGIGKVCLVEEVLGDGPAAGLRWFLRSSQGECVVRGSAARGVGRDVNTEAMRIDFDPAQSDRSDFYSLMTSVVVPRPIAWVSTTSAAVTDNLARATFVGKRYR